MATENSWCLVTDKHNMKIHMTACDTIYSVIENPSVSSLNSSITRKMSLFHKYSCFFSRLAILPCKKPFPSEMVT